MFDLSEGHVLMKVINALTVDVEEYFQVTAFDGSAPYDAWESFESRVEPATYELLSMLAKHDVRGTFFVVGWVAKRHPCVVKAIQREGHEIACHGYAHRVISEQAPESFRADVELAKRIIEDITGEPVRGYRAPTFSITKKTLWALDALVENEFQYDSSIFPIIHDRYGIPDAERFPNVIHRRNGHSIWEFPISTIRVMGVNLPFSGGGYMRLLPPRLVSKAIDSINRKGHPAIIYMHPWEIDPGQPRINASPLTEVRHYHNISRMARKLQYLLPRHKFGPVSEVLAHYRQEHSMETAGAPSAEAEDYADSASGSFARRLAAGVPSRIVRQVGLNVPSSRP